MKIVQNALLFPLILGNTAFSQSRPNIILINVDDMGWKDVSYMGSEFYETPNIDELAAQGMVFTNAYASASNCAPSRACLMTGQWTPRHGVFTVGSSERGQSRDRKLIPVPNRQKDFPGNHYLISNALKDAGYITCIAGKWHLSDDPTRFGFDINIGGCHAGHPDSYYAPFKKFRLDAPSEGYYLTTLIMDKTIEFISSTQEKPFFLYYAPYAVHTPIDPVHELLPKYKDKPSWQGQSNAEYATMIENLDAQIGRMVALLKQTGKFSNTFILFSTDNGGHYRITKQLPLRSGKGSYYEGGIRVPMFVVWPKKIQHAAQSEVPVTNLDFYPTILAVAGIQKPIGKVFDGQSILPVLTGNGAMEERALYWHFPFYLEAYLKEGDPTQDPKFRTRPGSAIRSGDWKLIQYFENNDLELYNLKNDIGENNNLAKSCPQELNSLLNMLEEWRETIQAPVPTQLNPNFIDN